MTLNITLIQGGGLGDSLTLDHTLIDNTWNNQAQWTAKGGVYWFEQLCHLVHDPNAGNWTQVSFYCPPAIVSGGPNKRLGFTRLMSPPPPAAPVQPVLPEVLLPAYPVYTPNFGGTYDNVSPIPYTQDWFDNLINYSLK